MGNKTDFILEVKIRFQYLNVDADYYEAMNSALKI